MAKPDPKPARTLKMVFKDRDAFVNVDDPIHKDRSTAARHGDALFVTCDETAGIDRITEIDGGHFGDHVHFDIGENFDLPAGPDGEMDIEGIAVDGDWMWVMGSNSLTRGKPKPDAARTDALDAMGRIWRAPNRAFIGRFPVVQDNGGPRIVRKDGDRRAASIRLHRKRSVLKRWLTGDTHIGPFLDIPSKENGLDLEGIAAKGMRIWLGLRGPVLREHAVILELEMKITKRGRLKARKLANGRRYRKHLVNTKGMGLRDLRFDGDDLLLLTGTVMAGDGPSEILRWRNASAVTTDGIEEVEHVIDLPYRGARDHPEGLCDWGDGEWLVVYDSPAEGRLGEKPASVTADIWRF